MSIAMIVVVVVLTVVVGRAVRLRVHAEATRRASLRFGRGAGLVPDAVAGAGEPLRTRALVGASGAVLGGLGVGTWMASTGVVGSALMLVVWAAAAALITRGAALAVVALITACRRLPSTGPRVARAARAGPGDYVPLAEQVLAILASLLPGAVLVVWALATRAAAADVAAAVWPATASFAGLVIGAIVAHRISARPQPAGTTLELAWDDAIRARTLRDLAAAVALVGSSYGMLSVMVFGIVPAVAASPTVTTPLGIVFAVLAAAATLVTVVPGPAGRFRRRLWGALHREATTPWAPTPQELSR